MARALEAGTAVDHQMGKALQSLPAVRRWLLRSMPLRQPAEGSEPLSLSHVRVLIHLYQHGPMRMGELARGLGIACSTATECVAGLESRDRVVRDRSPEDRRQVVVRLTPEAEAVAFQIQSHRKLLLSRVLEQMSPREAEAFVKGLSLLAAEAESWMDRTPAPEQTAAAEAKGA